MKSNGPVFIFGVVGVVVIAALDVKIITFLIDQAPLETQADTFGNSILEDGIALAQQDEAAAESFLREQEGAAAWAAVARDTAYALASTYPDLNERLAATLNEGPEQEQLFSRIRRLSGNASSDEEAFGAAAP